MNRVKQEWNEIIRLMELYRSAAGIALQAAWDSPRWSCEVSTSLVSILEDIARCVRKLEADSGAACTEEQVGILKAFSIATPLNWGNQQFKGTLVGSICKLADLQGKFEATLSNNDAYLEGLTDRALSHLRRSLVVDDLLRNRWIKAFNKTRSGETGCEKLGAVHLLLHGIFAIKAGAGGAITDLVFTERIVRRTKDNGGSEGFVLTEWKVAEEERDVEKKVCEAECQLKQYAGGLLAPYVLESRRYIILVSKRPHANVPEDFEREGVTYRVVNVAIDPKSASAEAREQSSRRRSRGAGGS